MEGRRGDERKQGSTEAQTAGVWAQLPFTIAEGKASSEDSNAEAACEIGAGAVGLEAAPRPGVPGTARAGSRLYVIQNAK